MKNVYYTALMAFAALVFATVLQAADETAEDALSVSVMVLSKIAIPVERDVEAKLISPNDTPVSPELAAKVLEIKADVGDEVNEGDVLARLDCRTYDVRLRQAKAGVSTVKARIKATAARVDAAASRVGAAESRVGAAGSRVSAAGSRVGATESQVNAAASRVHAAASRVKAAEAGIQAATARMQATGTGINMAKSRVNTAKAQANAARARVPAAQAQFKLAQSELNRNRQLRNKQLIPANVLDQAQATFNSAQSNLSAAQADYAAAQAAVLTASEEINAAAANLQAGKADVASSQASVETVKAELGSSKADLGTAKANMGTTKADMETAKAEVQTAKAGVETARADLEGAKADLLTVETELENALAQQAAEEVVTERCLVKAPFDGQITQRQFQLGQISAPGRVAFQLLQHQGLEVVAQLSPDELLDQEQGKKVRFVSGDVEFEVERRAVVAQVASGSGTQEVRYRVNGAHDLPVGKTGRVRWQGELPAIPPDWLLRREGGLGLMLAVDGKAEFYPLQNAREGQPALVDLPEDTLLIDANRLRARNGQKIQQAGE